MLTKKQCEEIAKSKGVTYGQVRAMLKRAKDSGAANTNTSRLNKGCDKATAFNIFWNGFNDYADTDTVKTYGMAWYGVRNALVEFGEFWHDQPAKETRPKRAIEVHHEAPIDIDWTPL